MSDNLDLVLIAMVVTGFAVERICRSLPPQKRAGLIFLGAVAWPITLTFLVIAFVIYVIAQACAWADVNREDS